MAGQNLVIDKVVKQLERYRDSLIGYENFVFSIGFFFLKVRKSINCSTYLSNYRTSETSEESFFKRSYNDMK